MKETDYPYTDCLTEEMKGRIIELSKKSTDLEYLWGVYGEAIVGPSASGEPPTEEGKDGFNRFLYKFKESLCNDLRVQSFMNSDNSSDLIALSMVITAKLAADNFAGIDICAAGVLIARLGLRKICEMNSID